MLRWSSFIKDYTLRNVLKLFLKLGFAAGIIYWLLKSGKLDFSLVSKSLTSGYNWLFCILIIATIAALSAIRWRWLLKINSDKELPLSKIVKVTWIGLFFNSFLPGAVTGDFIKLLYVRDLDPKISKTYLVTSVLIDRILGLMGLLTIMGLTTVFYYREIVELGPKMEYLLQFNLLLFAGAIVFMTLLFAPQKFQDFFLELSKKIPIIGEKVHKTLSGVWLIGGEKKVLAKCILISTFLQACNFGAFYIISSPFYGREVPFTYIVSLIPIGFISVAIPISPAGLGVGHYIFDLLFNFLHIEGGASFFNLFFICMVLVNSMGIFPYLFAGKKHTLEESEAFEEELQV